MMRLVTANMDTADTMTKPPHVTQGTQQPLDPLDGANNAAYAVYYTAVHVSHHQSLTDIINTGASATDL